MKNIFIFILAFTLMFGISSCKKDNGNNSDPFDPTIPGKPSNPVPANISANISQDPILEWNCYVPAYDTLTYDVYLGNVNPTLLVSGLKSTSIYPGRLLKNTKYYWKVIARNTKNNSTDGPVWSFTTGNTSDLREQYIGNWHCTEDSKLSGINNFDVSISMDTNDSKRVLIFNFYAIGTNTYAIADASPSGLNLLSNQNISGYKFGGSGVLSGNNKINWSYNVINSGETDIVYAVYTKF